MQRRENLGTEGEGLLLRGQDAKFLRLDGFGEERWSRSRQEIQAIVEHGAELIADVADYLHLQGVPDRSPKASHLDGDTVDKLRNILDT